MLDPLLTLSLCLSSFAWTLVELARARITNSLIINAGIDFGDGEYSSEALLADLKLLDTVLGESIRQLEGV